jgi:hypothetical protein
MCAQIRGRAEHASCGSIPKEPARPCPERGEFGDIPSNMRRKDRREAAPRGAQGAGAAENAQARRQHGTPGGVVRVGPAEPLPRLERGCGVGFVGGVPGSFGGHGGGFGCGGLGGSGYAALCWSACMRDLSGSFAYPGPPAACRGDSAPISRVSNCIVTASGDGYFAAQPVKNALSDVSAERFEVACYRAIAAAAIERNEPRVRDSVLKTSRKTKRWHGGSSASYRLRSGARSPDMGCLTESLVTNRPTPEFTCVDA